MILGFEEITADLTEQEITLALWIASRIKNNIGAQKAASNGKIAGAIKKEFNATISSARIRKMINYIRMHGLVPNLVASSKGYYVSRSAEENRKYVYSLRQRGHAIMALAQALEDQGKTL